MKTSPTTPATNNTSLPSVDSQESATSVAEEQDNDPFWINHYPSIASALERPSSPTSPKTEPPTQSSKRSVFGNSVKLTPFQTTQKFAVNSNPSSIPSPTPSGKDKLAPIYPSEILSPPGSSLSERNSVKSPLKSVRFTHTDTYHTDLLINPPTYPYAPTPPTTASAHTRAQSDPKRDSARERVESRPKSDPYHPGVAVPRFLPLRGDIPVVKMSSRSGKRVERDRSDSLRNREYEPNGREYGPPNMPRPIRPAAKDLEIIARIESSLILQSFTCDDAWALGCALRDRLLQHDQPTIINISLSSGQVLFHCCPKTGSSIHNSISVDQKRNTVLRWGVSTWYLSQKYGGDEEVFGYKNSLGMKDKGEYCIAGGGLPIRVQGVEGIVAVVVVCGLKGEEDHEVIVETIQEYWY